MPIFTPTRAISLPWLPGRMLICTFSTCGGNSQGAMIFEAWDGPPRPCEPAKVFRLGNLPAFWNQYKSQELIPTLWGSAAMRERVLSDEWEWDKKVEADTSQAQREGTVPPIDEVLSVSPTTLADFFALRASGGRFRVDKGMTKKAQEFNPAIRTMDDLQRELYVLGYDTERQGQTVIAHVRPCTRFSWCRG